MSQDTARKALTRAIEILGSQTALAASVGADIKTGHVFYWLRSGSVPAAHCPAIERATDGQVTRRDLRPADWAAIWPELAADQQGA